MRGDSGLQPMSDQGWWACLPPGFRAAEKIQEQNTPLTLHRPLKQQPVPCLSLLWRPASDLPLPPGYCEAIAPSGQATGVSDQVDAASSLETS